MTPMAMALLVATTCIGSTQADDYPACDIRVAQDYHAERPHQGLGGAFIQPSNDHAADGPFGQA